MWSDTDRDNPVLYQEMMKDYRQDRKKFFWFLEEIVPIVIGKDNYAKVNWKELPSKWLRKSMEVYALMCLENYYGKIEDDYFQVEGKRREYVYTTDQNIKKREFQGWGAKAPGQFNEMKKKVANWRKTDYSIALEKEFLEKRKAEYQQKQSQRETKSKANVQVPQVEEVEFSDDEDDGVKLNVYDIPATAI